MIDIALLCESVFNSANTDFAIFMWLFRIKEV